MLKNGLKFILIVSGFFIIVSCYNGEKKLIPKDPNELKVVNEGIKLQLKPKADILFVVDDSGSMKSAQTLLSENISLFTAAMNKSKYLDYHIGVITTSHGSGYPLQSGRLQGQFKYVSRTTQDGLKNLENKILNLGLMGNGTERFFDPIVDAFDQDLNLNPGFSRKDAFLILILITDTIDQSAEYSGFKAYNNLIRLKSNDADRVLGYGVISYPDFFMDECDQDDKEPYNLLHFLSFFANAKNARIGGGVQYDVKDKKVRPDFYSLKNVFSLCDANFGDKLANIGDDIRLRVSQKIPLPVRPVDGTIRLMYGASELDQRWWKYDFGTNSIIIDPLIELSVEINEFEFSVVMDQADPAQSYGQPDLSQ